MRLLPQIMVVNIIEYTKDKYLTWQTGMNKSERAWDKWQAETIAHRANTIENMFMNFKYIIPVGNSIFDLGEPWGWVPNEEFKQYMYPVRELGNNTVYYFARGYRDQWDGKFHVNEMSGGDQVFIATNNEEDAIIIALTHMQCHQY